MAKKYVSLKNDLNEIGGSGLYNANSVKLESLPFSKHLLQDMKFTVIKTSGPTIESLSLFRSDLEEPVIYARYLKNKDPMPWIKMVNMVKNDVEKPRELEKVFISFERSYHNMINCDIIFRNQKIRIGVCSDLDTICEDLYRRMTTTYSDAEQNKFTVQLYQPVIETEDIGQVAFQWFLKMGFSVDRLQNRIISSGMPITNFDEIKPLEKIMEIRRRENYYDV